MARKIMDKVLGFIGFEEVPEEEEEYGVEPVPERLTSQKKKGTVLSLHAQRQLRVVVSEPKSFDEVQVIANNLKERRPVIVNLENADKELAKKVVDFVSGATYALNGSMQKIGNGIFLFVPDNIGISGNIKEELQEKGIFSWMQPQKI
ncbi:MAG TPA: cell division protein SepF [Clostridia bacterium]|nr:cell division protein SepF [Clostridia bacterium]